MANSYSLGKFTLTTENSNLPHWIQIRSAHSHSLRQFQSYHVNLKFAVLSSNWPGKFKVATESKNWPQNFKLTTPNSNLPRHIPIRCSKFKLTTSNSNSTLQIQIQHCKLKFIMANSNSPRQIQNSLRKIQIERGKFKICHGKLKFTTANSNWPRQIQTDQSATALNLSEYTMKHICSISFDLPASSSWNISVPAPAFSLHLLEIWGGGASKALMGGLVQRHYGGHIALGGPPAKQKPWTQLRESFFS